MPGTWLVRAAPDEEDGALAPPMSNEREVPECMGRGRWPGATAPRLRRTEDGASAWTWDGAEEAVGLLQLSLCSAAERVGAGRVREPAGRDCGHAAEEVLQD